MSDSVGSVSVEVVPDARGWSEKLRAQIRDTTARVDVKADTAEANAEIDEVARTRTARVKVDTDKSVSDLVKNVSLLPALFVAASAAAVPLAATIGGLAAALAAPIAIAGGGVGLFALFGALAAKQTESQLKNIDTLQKKLAGLTKGTQDYADTQKQLTAAQSALTPAQKDFASSLDGLKGSFTTLLTGKTGSALLTTLSSGMDLLSKTLPVVAPLLTDVSGALDTILHELGAEAGSRGFANFVDQVGRLAGRDLVSGAHILGNLAKGVGGLLVQFDKHLSGGLLDDLDHLSGSFASFGADSHSKTLREFFAYFHQVGPQVGDTIGAVARAVGHLVTALAPLGPPVLHIIKGIADAISSIPTGTLTGLLAATAGVSVAGYGAKKAGQFTGLLSNIPGFGSGGVQKVYVTNPGFGTGGVGGKPGFAGYIPGVAVVAAAAAIGFAKGHAETQAMGGKSLAQYAVDQVRQQQRLAFRQDYAGTAPHIDDSPAAQAQLSAIKRLQSTYSNLQFNNIPRGAPLTSSSLALKYGMSAQQARGLIYSPQIKSTSTALDAITANAAHASRSLDLIGPHAAQASAVATHAIGTLVSKLGQIHDEKFTIIAQTQNAITSLERLQAYRIQNKYFTVYQRSQALDRAVGPGGGMGQNPHGSGSNGSSGGGAGRQPVHVHLDDSGQHTLTGWMDDRADGVYHANRGYEDAQAGR